MKKTILLTALQLLTTTTTLYAASHPWHYSKRIINDGAAVEQTAYKLVNKGWRPRVKPGRHYDGEFVPFNEHFDKWVIITTNTIERVTTVPAHSVYRDTLTNLTAEVSTLTATNAVLAPEAAKAWKIEHAREKAEKKDKKNLDKLIADIIKARDKSSESMAGLYDSVLEVLTKKVEAVTEGE